MTLAKILIAVVLGIAWPIAASGQTPDLARTKDISEKYNECVYFSAVEHMPEANNDTSLAAESAFKACATEQDQLIMLMQQIGMAPEQIASTLLEKKTAIKREFRKMVLESRGIK